MAQKNRKPAGDLAAKAAAARAAAEASDRRRTRLIQLIGAAVVGAVFIGIIGIGVWGRQANAPQTALDPNAALPAGVTADATGIPSGVPVGTAGDDAPLLDLYEDFQCPGCGALEARNGEGLLALANDGKVRLRWHVMTFLDNSLPASDDSSYRASLAFGCAVDQGKAVEFHTLVFANQPAEEGLGFSDQVLIGLAEEAGITGDALAEFTDCYESERYQRWVRNSDIAAQQRGVPGTPTGYLDGQQLDSTALGDQATLERLVAAAAAAREQ